MDQLEQELRRVLTDPRRTPPADLVSLDQVHRGAARRRRRREAAAAMSLAAVVAGVVLAVAQPWVDDAVVRPVPAATTGNTSIPTTSSSPTPSASSSAISSAPSQPVLASDFAPVSVTAISPATYWVLGDQSCPAPCRVLAVTTDGGVTFHRLSAPTGSDTDGVRFGSAADGWLYGRVTHSTHDGGRSWSPVALPGRVVHLEAAFGTVWAVVESHSAYSLFTSPTGRDDWREVTLPRKITAPQPDLALQGSRMLLLANGSSADLYVSDDGGATIQRFASPCSRDLGGSLSAVEGAVWATCATGTMAKLGMSPDGGAPFQDVSGPSLVNSAAVGARSRNDAVVNDAGRGLVIVTISGQQSRARTPRQAQVSYLGFTTPQVGVAITVDKAQLWHTIDGGQTWTIVRFTR